MGQDSIDRACERNHVIAGSELEKELRRNFYYVVGPQFEDQDAKIDKWIEGQKANPYYAESLESSTKASAPEKPQRIDLSAEEFDQIRNHVNADAKILENPRMVVATRDEFEAIARNGSK